MTRAETSELHQPIRCIVIQLARLGDTLQSLMALRAAKQLYPQLEIHFVARERFAAAARRVPWISEVISFPSDSILGPVLSGNKREIQALADVARWLGPLVKKPWDLIVNWSYSDASSYLTGVLPGRVKLGYTRKRDKSFAGADGWSHYIQAIVQGQVPQNIHLTDILTTQLLTALQIHYGEPVSDGNSAVTSKAFFALEMSSDSLSWANVELNKKWIAIQLGAGNEAKTWAPENWAKVSDYILRRHAECGILLLGGSEDQERAERFMDTLSSLGSSPKRVVSLVGRTDFDVWASAVSRAQWLFSADTAAIHLASVLGTRVLNVSVGPVRWAETGPYGNGHYVVAPLDPERPDKREVEPEAVYATWSYAANEWAHRRQISLEKHFSQLGWKSFVATTRVFRSKIRGTDDGGGVMYEPLFSHALRLSDWTAMAVGHIARGWYCGWVPSIGQELNREAIGPALLQSLRDLDESAQALSKVCNQAALSAHELARRSAALKSEKIMGVSEKEKLHELGENLSELDRLIERLGKAQEPLLAFSMMARVLMHHLNGENLTDLGKESADSYRQLADGVATLRSWVKHTLDLTKPVAIRLPPLASVGALPNPKNPQGPNDKEVSP